MGPCVGRISPHNPKVAGSNPAPATTEVSKTKGVNRVDPFGLRQLTMKFFDRFATHSSSRPSILRPKIDLNATNAERGLRPVRSRRFIDAADGHGSVTMTRACDGALGSNGTLGLEPKTEMSCKVSPFLCRRFGLGQDNTLLTLNASRTGSSPSHSLSTSHCSCVRSSFR